MKKSNKFNIWTIVFTVIALIILGWLMYTYFLSPSQGMSNKSFFNKLNKKNIKEVKYVYIYRANLTDSGTIVINFEDKNNKTNTISTVFLNLEKDFVLKVKSKSPKEAVIINLYPYADYENKIEIKTSYPSSFFGIVFSFLPTLLWLVFIFFIFFRMGRGFGGFTTKFKGTELTKSNVMFSDVAGIEEEKKELLEIVDFLRYPQRYVAMGARIPKGLLLFGPPGTGKTLLAKAVSGESKVPFFSAAGSEFEEVLVGMGASRIRELFKKAKENAPCIIFIDEIDSLGSHRSQGISGVKDQTLNQFLAEMDGFESNLGVVVVAATNRADVLDPALLRSGRFDRKIQITLPDISEREQILKIHARKKRFADNIDFGAIASRTPGFTGAQLENSLNESALLAVRKNKKIIDETDIDEGIDRVIGGPAKISKVVNKKTRIIVAIHEAGHALIGLTISDASKVQKVTIIPRGNAGGYTITTPKDETSLYSKKSLEHQLIGFLGGRAAEEIIFGKLEITTGGHDDFSKATTIAKQMVERFGMSRSGLRYFPGEEYNPLLSGGMNLSESKKKEIDQEIDLFLSLSFEKAKKQIITQKKLLFLLAEALLILETIASKDIEYIYKNQKLPKNALTIKNSNPSKFEID